jgi:hypothetical protein
MTDEQPDPDSWARPRAANYAGTEVGGKWWRRTRAHGLFVKGNGHYWLEPDALVVKRLLVKEPIRIPYAAMAGATIGKAHGGTWLAGRPIVKIGWTSPEGESYSTGLGMGRRADAEALVAELQRRMAVDAVR